MFGIQIASKSGILGIFIQNEKPFKTKQEAETWLADNQWHSYGGIPGYFKNLLIATIVPYFKRRDVSEIKSLEVPERTIKPTAVSVL